MLIRNALIEGFSSPVDLRLMHGAVQEIGMGLPKGLYESELDLAGDELRPCPSGITLPQRYSRRTVSTARHIVYGTKEPLTRWHEGEMCGFIDSHSAD